MTVSATSAVLLRGESVDVQPGKLNIRRACSAEDVEIVFVLLDEFSRRRLLLGRSREEILKHLRSFLIAEWDGEPVGCVCLRPYGNYLYEVRSLAVVERFHGMRAGSFLVKTLVDAVHHLAIPEARLFALTYRSRFFRHLGFRLVDKRCFPEKIWTDCVACDKLHRCDEDAVLYLPSEHPDHRFGAFEIDFSDMLKEDADV